MVSTRPSIACSSSVFARPAPSSRSASSAYRRKTYRWRPWPGGGHGPRYPVAPKSFCPSYGARSPSLSPSVAGSSPQAIQCVKTPPGASGSSTTSANDRAPSGTFDQRSGGETSSPSQLWRLGIAWAFSNALLSSTNSAISRSDGAPPPYDADPPRHSGAPPRPSAAPPPQHLVGRVRRAPRDPDAAAS